MQARVRVEIDNRFIRQNKLHNRLSILLYMRRKNVNYVAVNLASLRVFLFEILRKFVHESKIIEYAV